MAKIVHLTTVHSSFDSRIFYRECQTLAAAGYEVVLVARHDGDEWIAGVQIRSLPNFNNRLARMTLGMARVLRLGLRERAAVYHFHDPELIPVGLFFRLLGKKVVYDVHEDYATAIQEREYLPLRLRPWLSRVFTRLENFASQYFALILAERYYAERFPHGQTVLNYSRFPEVDEERLASRPRFPGPRLIYTGNVKDYRGAFIHARLLELLPRAEVFLIGRCPPELADQLRATVAGHEHRLHFEGIGYYVPYSRIIEYYLQEEWTAGLAVFPARPHTLRKELTKIFEYMAFGIPVVCSDFPNLKQIVEGEGCGICVDPTNLQDVAKAIQWLAEHPDEAKAMGARGRRAARCRYSWDTEAEKLLGFYRELCPLTNASS